MRIGIVGLGKLGMPVALGISLKGHDVMGYDIRADAMQTQSFPHREIGPNGEESIEELLRASNIKFGSINQVAEHAEIIFIAIQTPHEALYEGISRIPESRKDFNYDWLISGAKAVSDALDEIKQDRVVVIISTVLPGTLASQVLPILSPHVKLCYNPFFIAMGTTIRDFYYPEFILFGVHDDAAAKKAEEFYKTINNDAPFYRTTLENAEMIKVSYNTFIGMKIVFANVVMEISHKLPNIDCDAVMDGLRLANRRLMSGAYLTGGMGDGGGCHPRDNIALSWLAQKLHLSYDWYESVMKAREDQTEWLANLIIEHKNDLPVVVLGKSFKPETNLITGSPAILLLNLLTEKKVEANIFDPFVDGEQIPDFAKVPSVFFIGTKHETFKTFPFPAGSVVLDPHRYIGSQPGSKVIPIGRGGLAL